jgi:uncharacterized protein involved in tolerance to divalent cations
MIFLRIVSKNEGVIAKIAETLLKNQLIIDVNIKRKMERLTLVEGKLKSGTISLLTAKTKSLLFNNIDDQIREIYPSEELEIYALPIVHMDWEDAKHLREDIKPI